MVNALHIDTNSVLSDMYDISMRNPDTEMAIAGWSKTVSDTTVNLQYVLEYTWAQKDAWKVSLSPDAQQETHEKIQAKWYTLMAQWHQHLEKENHAHDFSPEDEKAIKQQKPPVHILSYKTNNNTVRFKAVDTTMRPVPIYVQGTRMDIAEIFADGKVEEYKDVN